MRRRSSDASAAARGQHTGTRLRRRPRRHATRQVHQVQAAACSDLPSCSQPIAAHYVTNHLVSSHACFALARYGMYALRARSSATHVSPPTDMPHNVAASVWQCDASSNRLQVQSVTRVFSHSANGGDDYFVLCLLSSSRALLSSSHFERSWVQRAIDAAWMRRAA